MAKVRVFTEDGHTIIGLVEYNQNLDIPGRGDCGSVGRHRGLTRLKDGRFVLIVGTDWQGERDYAMVISEEEALDYILDSGNLDLLDEPQFAELKKLADSKLVEEDDGSLYLDLRKLVRYVAEENGEILSGEEVEKVAKELKEYIEAKTREAVPVYVAKVRGEI